MLCHERLGLGHESFFSSFITLQMPSALGDHLLGAGSKPVRHVTYHAARRSTCGGAGFDDVQWIEDSGKLINVER